LAELTSVSYGIEPAGKQRKFFAIDANLRN